MFIMTVRFAKKAGFTLIEMLVVIAIVALLVSLIVPAVNRSLDRAKTVKTMANLNAIGNAISLYSLDHNYEYPRRYMDSMSIHGKSLHWQEQVQTYIGKDRNSSFDYQRNPIFRSAHAELLPPHTNHFGLNKYIFQPEWAYKPLRVKNPSQTVLIGEINRNSSTFDPEAEPAYDGSSITYYRISNPGNTALYLFADYRVTAIKEIPDLVERPEIWKWW